ncbi:hypothetical protein CERSUDRAFT_118720 [Gelatoporia subvermispora B]|uniref:Uncharacterized protein n=1 Tax=Ceriporiopsis subvermispora (strain B) TaxID=914234 RepID=M2R0G6_CERS8|nr:hypothetical protein CERSUDRAFT_118720 [Gelatoporia subvermispora B]
MVRALPADDGSWDDFVDHVVSLPSIRHLELIDSFYTLGSFVPHFRISRGCEVHLGIDYVSPKVDHPNCTPALALQTVYTKLEHRIDGSAGTISAISVDLFDTQLENGKVEYKDDIFGTPMDTEWSAWGARIEFHASHRNTEPDETPRLTLTIKPDFTTGPEYGATGMLHDRDASSN